MRRRVVLREGIWTRRALLAALAAAPALAAEGELLWDDPPLRRPELLPGEAFLEDGASVVLPTIRAWDMGLKGGVRVEATTESVGDGVAARYLFPAGGAGRIVHERTKVSETALGKYEGVSFWVKGDGSSARGLVSFGDRSSQTSASFSLRDTQWRKQFVEWDRFDPPIRSEAQHLAFSIERAQPGPVHFTIDRIRLYATRHTEQVAPTPETQAPAERPASAFVAGREHVASTVKRLQQRLPATILFAGDSITAGAQLYYSVEPSSDPLEWERRWSEAHLFGLRAGRALARRYGYAEAEQEFERWDRGEEKWLPIMPPGVRPRGEGGLRTVVYGAGGKQSSFALEHMEDYLAHEPNLAVYQFAGNDLIKEKDMEREFGRNLAALVARTRAAGAEVALMTSPPMLTFSEPSRSAPYFHTGAEWADYIGRFAAEEGCALVDARGAFLSRGLHRAGDLYSDWAHPNHRGHELLANLAEELLTGT